MKIKYFVFILFGLFALFLGTQKVQAGETLTSNDPGSITGMGVVINEVYYNPIGTIDTGNEWIEIYNASGQSINLTNYQLGASGSYYTFSDITLNSQGFVIVHWNAVGSDSVTDLYTGNSFNNMNNDSGSVSLFNSTTRKSSTIIDYLEYGLASQTWESAAVSAGIWTVGSFISNVPEGFSIKRNPAGQDTNTVADFISQTQLMPPAIPEYISPDNNQQFTLSQEIVFSWTEEEGVDYEYQIAKDENFINLIDDSELTIGKYFWRVKAKNEVATVYTIPRSFEILAPVYSDAIIINELYPDPNGDATAEWIELYNSSAEVVWLKDWILEDLKGSSHQFKITGDLIIPALGYVVIMRTDSGITLNNDQDGVRLIRPDGRILFETPIFSLGKKGWSFARESDGLWTWTTAITPGAANIIISPTVEQIKKDKEDEDIPKNTTPIEIKTGEAQNHENYLVKITGVVVSTSGNTFYIDDGSGKVKVYIQEATGIDKPEMRTGDIFEIIGIVNFYRGVWRILPQKQDDIKFIQAKIEDDGANTVVKTAKVKTTTSASKSATTTAQARAPTATKKVASANINNLGGPIQIEGYKSPLWIGFTKAIIGLSSVFLVILMVKLWKLKKANPTIGDNFGDDFT